MCEITLAQMQLDVGAPRKGLLQTPCLRLYYRLTYLQTAVYCDASTIALTVRFTDSESVSSSIIFKVSPLYLQAVVG